MAQNVQGAHSPLFSGSTKSRSQITSSRGCRTARAATMLSRSDSLIMTWLHFQDRKYNAMRWGRLFTKEEAIEILTFELQFVVCCCYISRKIGSSGQTAVGIRFRSQSLRRNFLCYNCFLNHIAWAAKSTECPCGDKAGACAHLRFRRHENMLTNDGEDK